MLQPAMSRRAVGELTILSSEPVVLPAHVEIMLAVGDLDEARRAAEELAEIAAAGKRPMLEAIAAHVAQGQVELAEGNAEAALKALRRACRTVAGARRAVRGRTRHARSSGWRVSALGDEESAELELDAAREVFERLGAAPDLARLDSLDRRRAARAERARAGGAPPRRRREDESRDRRGARRQRAHGRPPPAEHLREARRLVTDRGDRVRLRAPPGLTLPRGQK